MSVTKARSRLANHSKAAKRLPSTAAADRVVEARRDLAAAKLEAYIKAVVEAAPPLTADVLDRLALLLRSRG